MNWTLFMSTFVTIFVAEMGDKTQFAALAAASRAESVWPIWAAVVLALVVAGTLGVFLGKMLSQWLDPNLMRYLSGGLFIAMGLMILFKKG